MRNMNTKLGFAVAGYCSWAEHVANSLIHIMCAAFTDTIPPVARFYASISYHVQSTGRMIYFPKSEIENFPIR